MYESKREIFNNAVFKSKKINILSSNKNILVEKFEKEITNEDTEREKTIKLILNKELKIFIIILWIIYDEFKNVCIYFWINLFMLIYNFINKPSISNIYDYYVYINKKKFNLNNEGNCKLFIIINLKLDLKNINNYCDFLSDNNYINFNFNNIFSNGNFILFFIVILFIAIFELINAILIAKKAIMEKKTPVVLNIVFILLKIFFYSYLMYISIFLNNNYNKDYTYENQLFVPFLVISFLLMFLLIVLFITYYFLFNVYIYFFYMINLSFLLYIITHSIDNNINLYDTYINYYFYFNIAGYSLLIILNFLFYVFDILNKYKYYLLSYFTFYSFIGIFFNLKLLLFFKKYKFIEKYNYIWIILEFFLYIIYYIMFYKLYKFNLGLILEIKKKLNANLTNSNFIVVDFPKILDKKDKNYFDRASLSKIKPLNTITKKKKKKKFSEDSENDYPMSPVKYVKKNNKLVREFDLSMNIQNSQIKKTLNTIKNEKDFNLKNEENKCVCCFENESNIVIMNCGHSGICWECLKQLWSKNDNCYICKVQISKILKVKFNNDNQTYEVIEVVIKEQLVINNNPIEEIDNDEEDDEYDDDDEDDYY